MNGTNNNIINIINITSQKYNLTREEINEIFKNYQNSTKQLDVIQKEIDNLGSFFFQQHILKTMCDRAPALGDGKNYYVTAFDNNSHIYLQPVSVTITNPETSEVLVENYFKGHRKRTAVDDIEIAICQIGRLLNFDVVEEYRLYNENKEKDSIIMKDLIADNEFYDVENLKKRFLFGENNGLRRKWRRTSESSRDA